jgi:cytoplasmic iron level regulating protein YaaA (DUF328/UPF0246 family)
MLMVISPAKKLNFDLPSKTGIVTSPDFLDDAQQLIDELKKLSPAGVSTLMKLSDKLGTLNFDRFASWHTPFTKDNAKPAVLAFKGDVYTGMDAESFTAGDFKFAQKQLRILSGLYGVLRPLDLMQAYRLEMGTKFANPRGENLYKFWGNKITDALNAQLKKTKSEVLLNLASNEYFKVVDTTNVHADIITPVFKDQKSGKHKIISFYAKKARGMMSAYIIKNRITDVNKIKNFDTAGYRYNKSMSSAREWVFIRDEQV